MLPPTDGRDTASGAVSTLKILSGSARGFSLWLLSVVQISFKLLVLWSQAPETTTPLYFLGFFFIVFNYMCICVTRYIQMQAPSEVRGVIPLGAGVAGGCEPPDTGTWKQKWVLCKSRMYS